MIIINWTSTFSVVGIFIKHFILNDISSAGGAFCSKLTNASREFSQHHQCLFKMKTFNLQYKCGSHETNSFASNIKSSKYSTLLLAIIIRPIITCTPKFYILLLNCFFFFFSPHNNAYWSILSSTSFRK